MPAPARKHARLLVRYGKHRIGETITGALADKLIKDKMAVDITPKRAKKAAPKKKAAAPANKAKDAAPENKAGDGSFDPNG